MIFVIFLTERCIIAFMFAMEPYTFLRSSKKVSVEETETLYQTNINLGHNVEEL